MNKLSSLLSIGTILLDQELVSRKRLFEEASLLFESAHGVPHTDAFEALFAREKLGCTCLGRGCAIPHGRLEALDKPVLCFIRTKTALILDAPDGKPVQLFFFVLVPEKTREQYRGVLTELCALLEDKEMRNKLGAATTPVEVCELINAWEPPTSDATESLEVSSTPSN